MKNVIALILGGGRGTRLYPLTKFRAKPAVPIGGKYRLIDIPLSNCINSGLDQIYVLTQFNSASLHNHLHSFHFDYLHGGFAEILAAQQTTDQAKWYQGTADAVRQNFSYIQQRHIEHVLILSGDQLYRMNFCNMLETHLKAAADVTISAVPVVKEQASSLGIMRLDDTGRVIGFLEKPQTDQELSHVRTDSEWIGCRGIHAGGREYLASMGIYLFKKQVLLDALEKTDYADFGKEVFPAVIRTQKVQVHLFDGYWEDIGTIKAFFEANLAMTGANSPFSLVSGSKGHADWTTYTEPRFLPPTRMDGAMVRESLVADGCTIGNGAVIENSIIGLRCQIGKGVKIRHSIIMGADYYETEAEIQEQSRRGIPPIGIGENSEIDHAIIDKDCHIGRRVKILNTGGVVDGEEKPYGMIRDGVICVQKKAVIPDGWTLE
ncbi:MAG: glucose-1-phosphate adenylyltransferase [Planctomycetaceae bacterium]|jgi:glucose-1-phosphate adenylyltransferase|nr:glucose-1-phosphate adenylyltransferase [Planctomycetaceae bacterium]